MNCHRGEPFPRQGDDEHRHTPDVARGPNDTGVAGLHCSACHQVENQAASGVPGAPDWHLAPVRMAWQGLSAGDLCRALQDPARGAMSPEQLLAHFNTGLVEWAWAPGTDRTGKERTPPPVSRDEFIALTKAWIDAGAVCPRWMPAPANTIELALCNLGKRNDPCRISLRSSLRTVTLSSVG